MADGTIITLAVLAAIVLVAFAALRGNGRGRR